MKKSLFLACGVVVILVGFGEITEALVKGSRKPPNILFLLADDLGWNDVGYHGSEIQTPTLDQLAQEGIRLENYYVQPICTPSRAQLLTGKMQIHTGLHEAILPLQAQGLPLNLPTVADALRAQGYATHAIGKWHLGFFQKEYLPTYRGFDSFYGFYLGAQEYFDHTRCEDNACGLDFRHDYHDNLTLVSGESGRYSTHLFAERARQVAKDHAENSPDKPLFMYVPFQAAHSPLEVPKEYENRYSMADPMRRAFAGVVTCMDEAVKNITDALKEYGLWENTIVIFSSDNGGYTPEGGSNYPLKGMKHTLWEGGVRAVAFVHSPLLQSSGISNRELIDITDWFPTLTALAGEQTTGLDGYDVWETISKGMASPRKEILHGLLVDHLSGTARPDSPFDTRLTAALRMDNWKLLTGDPWWDRRIDGTYSQDLGQNIWLHDIEADPTEAVNLAAERTDIVDQLLQRLAEYRRSEAFLPHIHLLNDYRGSPNDRGGVWKPWL